MREMIRPPIWLLAFIYFMFLSLVIAIWAALDNRSALIAFVLATVAIIAIAIRWKSLLLIDENELKVGRAHVQVKYIAKVEALSAAQMRLARTRDADPAAFLKLIFWIPTGVKVTLNDSRDSTPYWLISSKNPEKVTSTLYKLL
jgi:hypothetical protein